MSNGVENIITSPPTELIVLSVRLILTISPTNAVKKN